ncbi:hypothetical protein Tco_0597287 [Tanacetum coccineum]
MELKTSSSFKTTGLLQPWQTLCKIFSKCLTTRVTGWDQPPLQIMQMMYCFVNNIHVDYAELLWEGLYYSLHHPTSSIPYPRFIKIIVSHYMTSFHEISRRARDMYHNLQDDDIMKNIFNSGRHKDKFGMQILDWMITEEMKHTEHYRMYAEVFGFDVLMTQSQPTDLPKELIGHLAPLKIKKMVEGPENVIDDSLIPRNDESNIPGTRLKPRSDKESPKVEIIKDKEIEPTNDEKVEITNIIIPVNVNDEEEEITDEIKFKRPWIHVQQTNEDLLSPIRPRDQDDPHDDAHPKGENSAKRQKTSEYEAYVSGESSSRQVNEEERGPSTSGNQEQCR